MAIKSDAPGFPEIKFIKLLLTNDVCLTEQLSVPAGIKSRIDA